MTRPTDAEMAEWERGIQRFDGVPMRARLKEMFTALVGERNRADEAEQALGWAKDHAGLLRHLTNVLWSSRRIYQDQVQWAEGSARFQERLRLFSRDRVDPCGLASIIAEHPYHHAPGSRATPMCLGCHQRGKVAFFEDWARFAEHLTEAIQEAPAEVQS